MRPLRLPWPLALLILPMLAIPLVVARAQEGNVIRDTVLTEHRWDIQDRKTVKVGFPDSTHRFRKIILRYKMRYTGFQTGDDYYDYTTQVFALRPTGKQDSVGNPIKEAIEISRAITAYGNFFSAGTELEWMADVTDFAPLFRDSVEIQTFYDGWKRGPLLTLWFEMTEGIPPMDVHRVEKVYAGSFRYGDPSNSIENALVPKTFPVDPNAGVTTLKITTTGHGFGGTDNAAEFSPKTHTVAINGTQAFSHYLWRDDCGRNPTFPQGGTWWLSRAGWCPGLEVTPYTYDLTPLIQGKDSVVIDYNMEPYTNAVPDKPASYYIYAYVMSAGQPNFQNDAEIVEVQAPNNEYRFRRLNPICSGAPPTIVVRNTGKEPLTQLMISYGINGSTDNTFNWTGNLKFLESAQIALPGIDLGTAAGTFQAVVSQVNGVADEYAGNSNVVANFTPARTFANTMYVSVRTDDIPDYAGETTNGISYTITALDGTVMLDRSGLEDNVTYRDTVNLPNGGYRFRINDEGFADGLWFFFSQSATKGSYSLRDSKGKVLINATDLRADFGSYDELFFTVANTTDAPQETPASADEEYFTIYPNPTDGRFMVAANMQSLNNDPAVTLRVFSMLGEEVHSAPFRARAHGVMQLDLSLCPPGTYTVQLESADRVLRRRIVITGK
ncbi:MAG: T9SS C-terminal target domain-containing protein [Chlorobi bacterium CHB2]|nr:T9SS C-terminal target domain-containing protein [Chlorobi bacterium CHB2]